MDKNHSLHYFTEHRNCKHYLSKVNTGFVYREFEAEMEFALDNSTHHLLIFMEGSCFIDCNRFTNRLFSGGEMVLIPMSATFAGKVEKRLRFIDMCFETPLSYCDKMVIQSYSHFRSKICYTFRSLPVRKPLPEFCNMLAYCLDSGFSCEQFHEMKHRELFFYLRGYYSKEEITELLYPIVDRSMDFKVFVCKNFSRVDSLDELVKLSNMSKRTFFRKFKTTFNTTAYQWMLKQTVNTIIDEFSKPDAILNEVAKRLGFHSISNFSNFCKRNTGYTPTELIQKCRNNEIVKEDIGC